MSLHSRTIASGVLTALVLAAIAGFSTRAAAQESTAPVEGLRENRADVHLFTDAKIVGVEKTLEKGSLLVRDGKIVAIGEKLDVPPGARVWSLAGKTIYPGFIDAYSEAPSAATPPADAATFWNDQAKPERRVAQTLQLTGERRKELRKVGIVAALIAPSDGVVRGQSALVSTADGKPVDLLLNESVALHVRLTPQRGRGRDAYPGSPMGAVALFRQLCYDAGWQRDALRRSATGSLASRPEMNASLTAMERFIAPEAAGGTSGLVVFDAPDELYALRAHGLANEFSQRAAIRGSGREYRRLAEIAATKRPFILPLNFPAPPDVSSPTLARDVSLERLMHWDLAPANPAKLAEAKVSIAFTTQGLKKLDDFLPALRTAVARGLPAAKALRALTTTPADLFGAPTLDGRLEPGATASFVVVEGDLFADDKAKVVETWVEGRRYTDEPAAPTDLRGTYRLEIAAAPLAPPATLIVSGEEGSPKGKLAREGAEAKDAAKLDKLTVDSTQIRFVAPSKSLGLEPRGVVLFDGVRVGDRIDGNGVKPDGSPFRWSAVYVGPAPKDDETKKEDEKKSEASDDKSKPAAAPNTEAGDESADKKAEKKRQEKSKPALFPVNFPLGAWGVSEVAPAPAHVLFKNATVWVCDGEKPLVGADVLVSGGKIAGVGKDLAAPAGAVVIDATGKHLSPGLIDCHSHSATDGGINEATQSITAEVRIGDFIDCDDVNIYRQLAGGVTAINVLHGSANCIGGQNAVLKLRWGLPFDGMRFADAPAGIKFALGENVKQSNWGEDHVTRYPQSRLGVEQVVRDAFQAAKEYTQQQAAWKARMGDAPATMLPPRRDLELDALSEVLAGRRLIHCHSYRQDEIVAFLRVCEEYGVKVATLQHILEGYKVAEVLQKHGAGGSSFSDWWAYKFEVIDSIPYNGAIMHNQGILVSFNSDSNELARRLAWETAKGVKYGGVPEPQALQFVTLNPAKQLRIDGRVGSLTAGKDADLVVWSGSPLSSLSVCEQTWIEGRKFFDRSEDSQRQAEARRKKAALMQRVLDSGEDPAEEEEIEEKSLWPRSDEFCHHGHGHDGHGHGGHKK
ncbi:MAG TPA: amidohydrolase family protein [Pirellulales bacterium]